MQDVRELFERFKGGSTSGETASESLDGGLSPDDIARLVGTSPNNVELYERALTHRSVSRDKSDEGERSNERLEFLGDAVLGLVVAEYLYEHYPDAEEGFLSKLRSKLVNNKRALAEFARSIGLPGLIRMSENMVRSGGRSNASILADSFEAVIGALYLDQGAEAAHRFVLDIIEGSVDLRQVAQRTHNYKSALQEYIQSRGGDHPSYSVVSETGPSHDREFTVEVQVRGRSFGPGIGSSKKKAEQRAARKALQWLREQNEE